MMARTEGLEGDVLVEQQGEPEAEAELTDGGEGGVEQRVGYREPEDAVVKEAFEVFEPDEVSGAADLGVGEGEPDSEAERVGEEDDEDGDGREEAEDGEEAAVVEQADEPGVLWR